MIHFHEIEYSNWVHAEAYAAAQPAKKRAPFHSWRDRFDGILYNNAKLMTCWQVSHSYWKHMFSTNAHRRACSRVGSRRKEWEKLKTTASPQRPPPNDIQPGRRRDHPLEPIAADLYIKGQLTSVGTLTDQPGLQCNNCKFEKWYHSSRAVATLLQILFFSLFKINFTSL